MPIVREINLFVAENVGVILTTLVLLLLAMAIIFLQLNSRLQKLIKRYNALMRGVDKGSLEALLEKYVDLTNRQATRLGELDQAYATLSEKAKFSVSKVGLVRFNAFDGVGGNQSFSLAMLNENGDGIVVTSLFGRSESAIYAKPVKGGTATLTPSSEEADAIEQALSSR